MIAFSKTTAFGLVRRLAAAGADTSSVYLLICEAGSADAVRADLKAEMKVQLALTLRPVTASELPPERLAEAFPEDVDKAATLITIDKWRPRFVAALDRNVVLATAAGTVLLLASMEIAERVLAAAPNLRNRLTDVLEMQPDKAFGDSFR